MTTANRLIQNCNRALGLCVFLLFALPSPLTALHASPLPEEKTWHLLIEPKFMHPEVSFPIPQAERTVYVPGYLQDGEPVYFTKAEFDQIHLSFDQFLEKSRTNSSENKVTAKFVRTSKQIIAYALLQSESPLMATAVFAPDFIEKFKNLLGEKLIVAIPNRNTIFVFPAETSDYRDYAAQVLEIYKESAHPVSVEVFEISKTGLRTVGIYEP